MVLVLVLVLVPCVLVLVLVLGPCVLVLVLVLVPGVLETSLLLYIRYSCGMKVLGKRLTKVVTCRPICL